MRFSTAIGLSGVVHFAIAVGIVAYMKCAGPTTLATLDLTSVELSFAEEEDETAAVAPSMPLPTPSEPPAPPKERPPETELEKPDVPLPPEPDAFRPPEPDQTDPLPEPRTVEAQASSSAKATEDKPRTNEAQAPSARDEVAQAPKQAKVDAPPKPHRAIKPDYPKGSRQRGEQGDVVLEIRVNDVGTVDRVEVVSSCGFPELDEAAVRAAKSARFTPAKSGKRSVASTARLTLTFRLK